jgi:hypothetical protein
MKRIALALSLTMLTAAAYAQNQLHQEMRN